MKDLQEIDETRLKEAVQTLMSRNAKPYWEKFGSKVPEENEVLHFGWPDRVIPHGCVGELKREFGLTAEAVAEKLGSL